MGLCIILLHCLFAMFHSAEATSRPRWGGAGGGVSFNVLFSNHLWFNRRRKWGDGRGGGEG